jgi:hypothetical protein
MLDLEFFSSNAVSFVPVYLRQPGNAIRKPDAGNSLSFPPAAAAIELAQSPDFPNGRADRERLDMGDVSNDLEVHEVMLSKDNQDQCNFSFLFQRTYPEKLR